jgi:hypothetical protein
VAGSEDPAVAAVDDEFGSSEVRRGVGDEKGNELGHLGGGAGASEGNSASGVAM